SRLLPHCVRGSGQKEQAVPNVAVCLGLGAVNPPGDKVRLLLCCRSDPQSNLQFCTSRGFKVGGRDQKIPQQPLKEEAAGCLWTSAGVFHIPLAAQIYTTHLAVVTQVFYTCIQLVTTNTSRSDSDVSRCDEIININNKQDSFHRSREEESVEEEEEEEEEEAVGVVRQFGIDQRTGMLKIPSRTRVSAKLFKGCGEMPFVSQKLRQAELFRGEWRLARREVHLALWDACVIEGGHSTDKLKEHGDRCQKLEKKRKRIDNKNKRSSRAHRSILATSRAERRHGPCDPRPPPAVHQITGVNPPPEAAAAESLRPLLLLLRLSSSFLFSPPSILLTTCAASAEMKCEPAGPPIISTSHPVAVPERGGPSAERLCACLPHPPVHHQRNRTHLEPQMDLRKRNLKLREGKGSSIFLPRLSRTDRRMRHEKLISVRADAWIEHRRAVVPCSTDPKPFLPLRHFHWPSNPQREAMEGQLGRGFAATESPFQSALREAKAPEIPRPVGRSG
ncbi:unnamed protein product, partial [Pleuronectes platessa]